MLTDAVLVDRVIAGFDDAFDELYRRHAGAAWRLAQAVTGNAHDAADAVAEAFARVLQAVRDGKLDDGAAFRPYLLTATRNAGLDGLRRAGKTRPTERGELDGPSPAPSPADHAVGEADAVLIAEAFRNLPERWRSVLWLTEVEGVATKDAAEQLGMSANGTAQLAVRARAGLRDRYLQAHVRNHARPECRFTVDHLGAYVGGGISPRDLAKVDQHLADCADCRARREELDDLGDRLRRIVLPIPLTLGARSAGKVNAVLAASSVPATAGLSSRALQLAKRPTPAMQKFVGASAAGVLALGLLSVGLVSNGRDRVAGLASPKNAATADPVVLPDPVVDTLTARFSDTVVRSASAAAPEGPSVQVPVGAPATAPEATAPEAPAVRAAAPAAPPAEKPVTVTTPPAPATQPEVSAPLPEPLCSVPVVDALCGAGGEEAPGLPALPDLPIPDVPTVDVGASVADQDIAVSIDLDEPAVGVVVGPIAIGDPAPTPESDGLEVSIGGTPLLKLP